jgi:cytochrome c oxidase cbb3-type subunit III
MRWRRAFVFVTAGAACVCAFAFGAGGFASAKTQSHDMRGLGDGGIALAQQKIGGAGDAGAAAVGKQVWAGNCAGCHGLDGRGGERGPNIATNPEIASLTDEAIAHIVREGSPNMAMPALGRTLTAEQIAAVVKHLRTLQGDQRAAALPGDAKAGEALFYGKAECSSCHMVAGTGGFLGQDLTEFARSRAPEEIREAIVHPTNQSDPRAKTATVVARDGRKYFGIIRNEDNFSVQMQTPDGAFRLFDRSEIASVTYQKQTLMPADYGTKLSAGELNDIVSFLMSASRANEPERQGGEHRNWEDKDED